MNTKSPVGASERLDAELLRGLADRERGLFVIGRPAPILKRVIKPAFTWEHAEPGFTFPALEYTISRGALEQFLSLAGRCGLEMTRRQYKNVPMMFFTDEPMQCIVTLFQKSGRLHASHEMEGFQPVPVGATVRSIAKVENRFIRSIGQFVKICCVTAIVDECGLTPAVKTTATLVL